MDTDMIIFISRALSTLIMVIGYVLLFSDNSYKYREYFEKALSYIFTLIMMISIWDIISFMIQIFITAIYEKCTGTKIL